MAKKAIRKATKKAKSSKRSAARKTTTSRPALAPLRYAQPFFTSTPPSRRAISPRTGTTSMANFAAEKLGPIPPPTRDPTMKLQDIIGQPGVDEIQQAGAIKFHVGGHAGPPRGHAQPKEQGTGRKSAGFRPNRAEGARSG